MRRTPSLVRVAAALMARPNDRHWGYDLSKETGLRSGSLYPILGRLHDAGWLADGWEQPGASGRPPRRYYTVTKLGKRALAEIVETP